VTAAAQRMRAVWAGRPGRSAALVAVLAACLALAAAAALGALASRSGTGAAVTSGGLRPLGPARAGERINFTLLLRLPGASRLRRSLAAIENPRSPRFRQFIHPRAFGARFGITNAELAALERTLRADGLRITASYPQRTAVSVSGNVGTVERLLRVRIITYAGARGKTSHAPLGAPQVPAAIRPAVAGVTGLDTRPRWLAHDVPINGLTPADAAGAYDIAALHNAGYSGQRQTIALISFSAFDPSDPAGFASSYGIGGPAPQVVPVDGGTTDTSGAVEANLDIDILRAIAPAAQILVYEVPQSSSGYSDAINMIVAQHRAQIISSSWGQCELALDSVERAADGRALASAVAAGVSMFVAAGDSGAFDCQSLGRSNHQLSVDWPAASANAIAVGGTRLYMNGDGSYGHEAAWEDVLSQAGGGGGFTTGDKRPSWQTGPGVLDRYSNGNRQLPDVSGNGDPGTPWAVYVNHAAAQVGGTSAATPFWAASMALVQQYAAAQGAGRTGYVNPILYRLAASAQQYPPFHDVTVGGNRYYQAAPGWDPATGLGSPDVYNLARDIVGYLRSRGGH
jgi:subtilase family serine protease